MSSLIRFTPLVFAALLAPLATAQDSVSKTGCSPGDAVAPWADASAVNGSEQVNDYVVDMAAIFSSWGTRFGLAPLVKSSKTSAGFFSSLTNAQGISRKLKKKVPFVANSYPLWTQPGFGVNNDPALNDPGAPLSTAGKKGLQFGAVFAETATTDGTVQYNGVVSAVVNVDTERTDRLYVRRTQVAVNGCDPNTSMTAIGIGGVDEDGNVAFRTDGFVSPVVPGCGAVVTAGNNVFLVDSLARNPALLNVFSGSFPTAFDVAATKWVVRASGTTYSTPTLMPESIHGGAPLMLVANFNNQYVRGTDFGATTTDSTHLNGAFAALRGTMSYTSRNFPLLGSTHGIGAMLAQQTGTNGMNVFGLGAGGVVTGTTALVLPANVVDNADGFANLGAGSNTFDHYHSQVAFQGGNGQVALNLDHFGNLLLAAQVAHPQDIGPTTPTNYIAVARIAAGGGVQWTMAGWNDGVNGKQILDGPGGTPIGQMVPLPSVDSAFAGPSVSAPMIDSAGNIWFIAPVEIYGDADPFNYALLRAVYEPFSFKYELELVLRGDDIGGTTALGPNSGRPYRITNMRIADSNSVASNTAWSQNISDDAFLGLDPTYFEPRDPQSLGGMVLSATVVYDRDFDGDFNVCGSTSDPASIDEVYTSLIYLGSIESSGILRYGTGCDGSLGIVPELSMDGYPTAGKPVTLNIEKAVGPTTGLLFFGLGQGNAPVQGICKLLVAPLLPIIPTLPIFGAGPGNGFLNVTANVPPTIPPGFTITMQAFIVDPGVPRGFSNTNGLQVTFQ